MPENERKSFGHDNHHWFAAIFGMTKTMVSRIMTKSYQSVEFVDQLNDADDLAQRILDGHAENGFVCER